MACRTGCLTKAHSTYGECCRDAGVRTVYVDHVKGFDFSREKRWNAELDAYNTARAEGIEPDGTTFAAIDKARKISDMTGKAYNGEKPLASFIKE